jgi:hypothetical protein
MCLPIDNLETHRLEKGEHRGFEWEIVHNGRGNRCGYIRVMPDHPWFEKDYNDVNVDVHGGITFAAFGKECPTHGAVAEWWVGFDCAHAGDAQDFSLPWTRYSDDEQAKERERQMDRGYIVAMRRDVVRDTDYVRAECLRLADQAAAAMSS